jgi:hypothetical protein
MGNYNFTRKFYNIEKQKFETLNFEKKKWKEENFNKFGNELDSPSL